MQIILFLCLLLAPQDAGSEQDQVDYEAKVKRIVERYSSDLDKVWVGARRLEELDDEAFAYITSHMSSTEPLVQLMIANTLLRLGEADEIDRPLGAIAKNKKLPSEQRVAALTMIREIASDRTDRVVLKLLSGDDQYEPDIRIAAAGALSHANRTTAREKLRPLLETEDAAVRNAAAIMMGTLHASEEPAVRRILRSLQLEPTAQGAQAALLLAQEQYLQEIERKWDDGAAKSTPELENRLRAMQKKLDDEKVEVERLQSLLDKKGNMDLPPLISTLLEMIEDRYASPERLKKSDLVVAAAQGMVRSIDPYSTFMDVEDTKDFNEDMAGEYAGIGAEVGSDAESGYLMILRPLYNGPAYETGLRTNDRVTEVEGIRIKGLPFSEQVQHLKGSPGSYVNLKVIRRGWTEEREFVIERQLIHLDTVNSTLLPGDVGYLSIRRFGQDTVDEFTDALDALEESGMRGLILDLRHNPGGYLNGACEIVDDFVGEMAQPIVTQKSGSKLVRNEVKKPDAAMRPDYPVVVLINKSSASASEIVAGALQDYKRATLIGKRTFGKGSVQRIIPMTDRFTQELGGETNLRLTVQYYYLPSGRSIHTQRDRDGRVTQEGGVEPDLDIDQVQVPVCRLEAVNGLLQTKAFEEYLDAYYAAEKKQLVDLAENGDSGDPGNYPGFDEHFDKRNETGADPDDIRYELRQIIRRRISDERGAEFACDYPEDRQLQRAIIAVLDQLGFDAGKFPQYVAFADSFNADEEKPKSREF